MKSTPISWKNKSLVQVLLFVICLTISQTGSPWAQTQTPFFRLTNCIQTYMNGSFSDAILQFRALLETPKLSKEIQESGYLYLIASYLQLQQTSEASKAVEGALAARLAFTDTASFGPSVRAFIRNEVGQSMGSIEILSEPYPAVAIVNDRDYGKTPVTVALAPGKHKIVVGGEKRITELKKGENKQVSFRVQAPEGVRTGPSVSVETGSWSSHQGRSDFLALGRVGISLARFTSSPLLSKVRIDAIVGGHYYPGILSPRIIAGVNASYHFIENPGGPLQPYMFLGGSKDVYGFDPVTGQSKVAPDGLIQAEGGIGLEYFLKSSSFSLYFEQGALGIFSGTSLADKATVAKVGVRLSR